MPDKLVSDNAKAFDNSHVREWCQQFHISHRFSAPRHHQGNAVAERAIESLLEKLTMANKADWELALPVAVISLNSRVHRTTLYEPMELMLGRSAKQLQKVVEMRQSPHDTYATALRHSREQMFADVISSTSDAQGASRTIYERHRRQNEFSVGDLVVCKTSPRRPKLSNRWEGPFEVVERDRDVYILGRGSDTRK